MQRTRRPVAVALHITPELSCHALASGRAWPRGLSGSAVSASLGVSLASYIRQDLMVALSTPRLEDDEQRLAALWEHDFDSSAADAEAQDDATATLFATAEQAHAGTSPHRAPGGSRAGTHPRQERRAQRRRLAGAAVGVLTASVLAVVALTTPRTPDDMSNPRPRATLTAPVQPPIPVRTRSARRGPRSDSTPGTRRSLRRPDRPHAHGETRERAQTSRGLRNARQARPSRRPSAGPHATPPRRQPPPVATSSACNEFPPC